MSFKKYLVVLICFASAYAHAGRNIEIDDVVTLMFPNSPERLDTLNQLVYHFDDESGYYACLVMRNMVSPEQMANLDLDKFYNEIYNSVQDPSHQCLINKQMKVNMTDIAGVEFISNCKVLEGFPELRYKRMFLYGGNLYIIDYWTYGANASKAESYKLAFFNSFKVNKGAVPAIPSAFDNTEATADSGFSLKNNAWMIGLIVALVVLLFFLRKKPKK